MAEKKILLPSLCEGVDLEVQACDTASCITAILRAKADYGYLAFANVDLDDAHLNDRGDEQWELWAGSTSFEISADAAAQIAATFMLRIDTIGKAVA